MTALDPQMERRCRESFGRQRAMATIGASVHAIGTGEVEIMMPFCARLTQQHGFVHAGVITMLCDTACGFATLSVMPADAAVLTTEFKIDLLSNGRLAPSEPGAKRSNVEISNGDDGTSGRS